MFFSISEPSNLQTTSPFLTLVPSGIEVADLVLAAVELADAVDGDLALDVAALGDGDAQRGLLGERHQRAARPSWPPTRRAGCRGSRSRRRSPCPRAGPATGPGSSAAYGRAGGAKGLGVGGGPGRLVRAGQERRAGSWRSGVARAPSLAGRLVGDEPVAGPDVGEEGLVSPLVAGEVGDSGGDGEAEGGCVGGESEGGGDGARVVLIGPYPVGVDVHEVEITVQVEAVGLVADPGADQAVPRCEQGVAAR